MTLSAKTSENYFLIGPSADTECKLHIPHEGDKMQGDHKKVKGWCETPTGALLLARCV